MRRGDSVTPARIGAPTPRASTADAIDFARALSDLVRRIARIADRREERSISARVAVKFRPEADLADAAPV